MGKPLAGGGALVVILQCGNLTIMNDQLKAYVDEVRKSGMSDEDIRKRLSGIGWGDAEISEVLGTNLGPQTPLPSAASVQPGGPAMQQASVSATGNLAPESHEFISEWSWGGFGLGWIYFFASRAKKYGFIFLIILFVVSPVIQIVISLASRFIPALTAASQYLSPVVSVALWFVISLLPAIKGRKWVWNNGKWADFEVYKQRQKFLDKIGIIFLIIGALTALALFGLIFALVLKTPAQNQSSQPPSTNTPTVVEPTSTPIANLATTTASSDKVATISVQTNYKSNPLRVLVTCKVNTTLDLSIFAFYSGIGGEFPDAPFGTELVPKTRVIDKTYPAPGQYNLMCIPGYGNEGIKLDSPYAGKTTITIGGFVPPTKNNITFNFQPRTGTMPLQIQASCSINTAGKVTYMAIGVDKPDYFAPDETLPDKYFVATTPIVNGANYSISDSGTLSNPKFWKGQHEVYCLVSVEGQTYPIISDPIQINFQ